MTATAAAWELIGQEGIFRLPGGRATYGAVMYCTATARSDRPRLARLDAGPAGIRQVNRWVDPDAVVEVLAIAIATCEACGGACYWSICQDCWICDLCGFEWFPANGPLFAPPPFAVAAP